MGGQADYVDLEGEYTNTGFHKEFVGTEYGRWQLLGRELGSASELLFKVSEVKRLAVKMNELSKENNTREELKRLQAEVKHLRAENVRLKADEKVNPRKEETLYKLIIAMAQKGYGYNPHAAKNSAATEIQKDLDELGVGLGESTVRKHLKIAKAYLPSKPIKT